MRSTINKASFITHLGEAADHGLVPEGGREVQEGDVRLGELTVVEVRLLMSRDQSRK